VAENAVESPLAVKVGANGEEVDLPGVVATAQQITVILELGVVPIVDGPLNGRYIAKTRHFIILELKSLSERVGLDYF